MLEDKWYSVLDKIDKFIPIYKVIDPIDKIVPSFIIFLLLLVGLLGVIGFGMLQPGITLEIKDSSGVVLEGIKVYYIAGEEEGQLETNGNGIVFVPKTEARILITEVGYKEIDEYFETGRHTITLEEGSAKFSSSYKKIIFQDLTGARLEDLDFKVRIVCADADYEKIVQEDGSGILEFEQERDCSLYAEILEPLDYKGKKINLTKDNVTWQLSKIEKEKGNIRVKIVDSDGKEIEGEFEVSILDGYERIDTDYASYGEVLMKGIEEGNYSLSIIDSDNKYANAREEIEITANKTNEIEVEMSKNIVSKLSFSVIDSAGEEIEDYALRIYVDGELIAEGEYDSFALSTEGELEIIAITDNYLYSAFNADTDDLSSNEEIEFVMQEITEDNSGVIIVEVIDEDEKKVKNAKIWIMKKESASAIAGPYLTNSSGITEIRGIGTGEYYLVIEKEPAFADTSESPFEVDIREETNVQAQIVIGNTKLVMEMKDETGEYLNGEIEVHSNYGIENYPINGKKEINVKATGQAYVIFKSDDFSDYYSLPIDLIPKKTEKIEAIMRPLNIGEPEIKFEGFYQASAEVDKLETAEIYEAIFSIEVPYGEEYEDSVFHFRIGDSFNVINEDAAITDYKAGMALGAKKGELYTGDYETDSEAITNRDGKWIDIEWNVLEAGIHFISIKFRVKGTAVNGSEIPFYYRASFDNSGIRLPESNNTEDLYASTYKMIKTIGTSGECSADFCYDSESILDTEDNLYVNDYELIVGNNYEIGFSILNNSSSVYSSSSLLLSSICMDIDYSLETSGKKVSGSFGKDEVEIDLGDYKKGEQIIFSSEAYVKGQSNCSLDIKIKGNSNIVFEKVVGFSLRTAKALELEIEDSQIVADSPTKLEIQVKDAEFDKKKEAFVEIEIELPDNELLYLGGQTNSLGYIEVDLPALAQNSIVRIKAMTYNYASETMEIKVGDFLSLPEQIRYNLVTSQIEGQVFFKIENLSEQDVYIKNISLEGEANGRINLEAFNAQLNAIKPKIIGNSEFEQPLKMQLSPNIKEMDSQENYEMELLISAEKEGTNYDYTIPLIVNISLGDAPDNEPCISVSMKEWNDATQQSLVESYQFTITNNCVRNEIPISVEQIRAKLVWIGNIQGNIEMSVGNTAGGRDVTLLNNRYVVIAENIEAEESLSTILRFNSSALELGELAEFQIEIDGKIKTDSGLHTLQSETITSEISIFDLEQCLVTEDELRLRDSGDSKSTILDFTSCNLVGSSGMDIKVCYMESNSNSPYCPEENSSNTHLEITPKNFTINKNITTKQIVVERPRTPGAYDLYIYGKEKNSSFWKKIKTIETIIEPKDTAFSLDKYKIFLLGEGSTDSVELINSELTTEASVKACAKTWKKASKKFGESITTGLSAGLGAGGILYLVAKAGAAIPTPAIVAVVIIAVVVGILSSLFGGDDCEPQTHDIMAYLINMKESGGISNDLAGLNTMISKDGIDISHDFQKQIVPIVFENTGLEENPSYATLTITARRHNYSDPTDYGWDSGFAPLDVRSSNQGYVNEKIRVKIITEIPEPELPEITEENFCTQGTIVGRTGETAIPRIKLDWTWDGIDITQCDADNENYIYCDAVQFNIEVMKKVQALREFMKINKDNLNTCPSNNVETNRLYTGYIDAGEFGVSKSEVSLDGANANLDLEIENNTSETQSVKILVNMLTPDMEIIEQELSPTLEEGINNFEFTFDNLEANENPYYIGIGFETDSEQFELLQETDNNVSFVYNNGVECSTIKSTKSVLGTNGLMQYIEANLDNIEWTDKITSIGELQKILKFDAYLIKDSYNSDFKDDFWTYYKNQAFYNAPPYFTDNPDGLYKFYENEKIFINRRYLENSTLQSSGRYEVRLVIDFLEDWKLFDYEYTPDANILVDLYLVDFPKENSIFYNLSFDGEIGLDSENGRQGYGTGYNNIGNPLFITDNLETKEKIGSNALISIETEINNNISEINSLASKKGKIMEIKETETGYSLISYPNLATPVILKTSAEEQDLEFISAYSIRKNSTPIEAGQSLLFWTGAGQCYDFEGLPVQEAFRETPDIKAQAKDLTNWLNTYLVKWDRIEKNGNLYLKSVVYTPKDASYQLVAQKNAEFLTPNTGEFARTIGLDGISIMPNNNPNEYIDSLKEVLEGIKNKTVCVTAGNESTSFFWNPAGLYEIGTPTIKNFEEEINDCIN